MMQHAALLFGTLALAACGASGPSGPKTTLDDGRFTELVQNCSLQGASIRPSNSTITTTEADGSTTTVTTSVAGSADQKTIVLPKNMGDASVGAAIICIKGELDRLNADASIEPPINIDLGF